MTRRAIVKQESTHEGTCPCNRCNPEHPELELTGECEWWVWCRRPAEEVRDDPLVTRRQVPICSPCARKLDEVRGDKRRHGAAVAAAARERRRKAQLRIAVPVS